MHFPDRIIHPGCRVRTNIREALGMCCRSRMVAANPLDFLEHVLLCFWGPPWRFDGHDGDLVEALLERAFFFLRICFLHFHMARIFRPDALGDFNFVDQLDVAIASNGPFSGITRLGDKIDGAEREA